MADLSPLADRMNDVEISPNAPLTETLLRRVGSNINYLLDFLGVTDGSTSPGGTLSDVTQAIELASSHTMDLVASFPESGAAASLKTIGTFPKQKFLNQIIYPVLNNQSGFTIFNYGQEINQIVFNIDGGGDLNFSFDGDDRRFDLKNRNAATNNRYFTKGLNALLEPSQTIQTGIKYTFPAVAIISDRDFNTDVTLKLNFNTQFIGSGSSIDFYREYVFDVGSSGF